MSAGKGDCPRNLGAKFRKNYNLINWKIKMTTPTTFAQAIKRIVELESRLNRVTMDRQKIQDELAKVNDRENKRIIRYLFEKKSLELEQNTKDLEERVVKTIGPYSRKGTVKDAVAKARELWALRKTQVLNVPPVPTKGDL